MELAHEGRCFTLMRSRYFNQIGLVIVVLGV